jgi:hypothetical protein
VIFDFRNFNRIVQGLDPSRPYLFQGDELLKQLLAARAKNREILNIMLLSVGTCVFDSKLGKIVFMIFSQTNSLVAFLIYFLYRSYKNNLI